MISVDWAVVVSLPRRGDGQCWCQMVCIGPGGVAIAALMCSLPQSLLYVVFFYLAFKVAPISSFVVLQWVGRLLPSYLWAFIFLQLFWP